MKRLLKKLFASAGYKLVPLNQKKSKTLPTVNPSSMEYGLKRWLQQGVRPNTIIDVGAAAGTWSIMANRQVPEASFVLMEPLQERKEELEALTLSHRNFSYVPYAVGKEEGEIKFIVSDDLDGSGIASGVHAGANVRNVRITSIPEQIKQSGLRGPYVVKLDTHGFEVPILEGCKPVIQDISLFIVECYGFRIADRSLLFWEMCQYMETLGFRLSDVVDVMNRPKDGAFWQCDAFFIPKDRPLFASNKYN